MGIDALPFPRQALPRRKFLPDLDLEHAEIAENHAKTLRKAVDNCTGKKK